ncbi:hypothetical protein AB3R30_04050 [Leptolyngbyaceae cyanobacterium UHCC 1019]
MTSRPFPSTAAYSVAIVSATAAIAKCLSGSSTAKGVNLWVSYELK